MELLYLLIVFLIIIVLLWIKRPLYQAILGGLAACALLYRIPIPVIGERTLRVITVWDSFSVLVSLYLITFLQRMLEARDQVKLASEDLNGLFHNRRVNATAAPVFIGFLPAAAAMMLCGDIVRQASDGYMEKKDQAFITSWIRHVPESFLPTYSNVLLVCMLSGISLGAYMLGMIVPVIVLILIGYYPLVHRLPKDPGTPVSTDRKKDLLSLISHLWTFLVILTLIIVFKISVVPAVAITLVLAVFVYRFKVSEVLPMFKSAIEVKLLLNTFLVLVLKEFIAWTGILELLPEKLSVLPIPGYLIFALMFLLGGIITGISGIIALGTPIAVAALGGSVPLAVMLMCMGHAASQISPTHVCLVVASEYYHISMGELIRKNIPRSLLFAGLMLIYYNILCLIL